MLVLYGIIFAISVVLSITLPKSTVALKLDGTDSYIEGLLENITKSSASKFVAIFILNETNNTILTISTNSKESIKSEVTRQLSLLPSEEITKNVSDTIDRGIAISANLIKNNQSGLVYSGTLMTIPIKCCIIDGVLVWVIGGRGTVSCPSC